MHSISALSFFHSRSWWERSTCQRRLENLPLWKPDAYKFSPAVFLFSERWCWSSQRILGQNKSTPFLCFMTYLFITKVHRVKWFRDRADVDRWREEVSILEAEAIRVPTWHQKTAQNWTQLSNCNDSPGHRAYAFKQAAIHTRLQQRFLSEWDVAKEKIKKANNSVVGR